MKTEREFVGTLLGFDDFVSEYQLCRKMVILEHHRMTDNTIDMVLDDVTE